MQVAIATGFLLGLHAPQSTATFDGQTLFCEFQAYVYHCTRDWPVYLISGDRPQEQVA